jgi:hypothetical protein
MKVFTVTKPGGTKEDEFVAYTHLLEDIGINVANVPRVPEPGTSNRWLYVWKRKDEAERFARELQVRTRDRSWCVHDFELEAESSGPVAPLDIYTIRELEGATYYLDPASRERVIASFPHTRLRPNVFLSTEEQRALVREQGPVWWGQVSRRLTGLTDEQVDGLGGYRVLAPDGKVEHEAMPAVPSPAR